MSCHVMSCHVMSCHVCDLSLCCVVQHILWSLCNAMNGSECKKWYETWEFSKVRFQSLWRKGPNDLWPSGIVDKWQKRKQKTFFRPTITHHLSRDSWKCILHQRWGLGPCSVESWTGRSGRLGCWPSGWRERGRWGGAGPSGGRTRWSWGPRPPGCWSDCSLFLGPAAAENKQ